MKKMLCLSLISFIAYISVCSSVYAIPYVPDAPPLPYLKNVSVKSFITRDSQGIFTYTYEIRNGETSVGDLIRFQIDISQPDNGMELPSMGLNSIVPDVLLKLSETPPMVPVSFPAVPTNWNVSLTTRATAKWGICCDDIPDVAPGAAASGFVLQSWGLPTIREFSAFPTFNTELLKYYPDVDTISEEDSEKVAEQLAKDRVALTYKGKTLGPTAPPEILKPVEFIQNLIKMKEEAYTLGWITSKGIEIGLDQKLENIKKKLQQGNTGAAKNILNAFINEVEAQGCVSYDKECPKGKHLKPEAYALLKYNAEYLAENMK